MRQPWIVAGATALVAMTGGLLPSAVAAPTKYCGERITEAEDTVKALEGSLGRLKNAGDRGEIEAWVAQAKAHLSTAKAAAQEEDCVREVELAKTLTQDALYLAAQSQ